MIGHDIWIGQSPRSQTKVLDCSCSHICVLSQTQLNWAKVLRFGKWKEPPKSNWHTQRIQFQSIELDTCLYIFCIFYFFYFIFRSCTLYFYILYRGQPCVPYQSCSFPSPLSIDASLWLASPILPENFKYIQALDI